MILAGDADHNIGDQAIRTATCDLIRKHVVNARISVVTARPDSVARDHAVHGLRRGPAAVLRRLQAMRQSDLVMVGGGGLFQDDDSLLKMPYWMARTLAANLGGRVAGFALGVGPLAHASSRAAARAAFAMMDFVSVRDGQARDIASPLTGKPVHVVPDPAFCLDPASSDDARRLLRDAGLLDDGRPILGVAVRRWFPPKPRLIPRKLGASLRLPDPQAGPEGQTLIRRMAQLLDRQVDRHRLRIAFLPTYCVASEADDLIARKIIGEMRHASSATILQLDDARLLKACTAHCKAVLGGRMHPLILASGMNLPVVGIAYNPKFHGFAQLIGAGQRVVDVECLVYGEGVEVLDDLLDRADHHSVDVAAIARCKAMVDAGIRQLLRV